jgi:hypothetical protein
MRVDLGRDGTSRVEHGDREISQDQRERRQRRGAAGADLAVALPAGQAAVQEPDGQCDPADGLRFRQVAQVRHHEFKELGQYRVGALLRAGTGGRLASAAGPRRHVRLQHLAEPRPV